MTTEAQVLDIFTQTGAIITGDHMVYTSWRHGTDYVDPDKIYLHPKETETLCEEIARQFVWDDVEVVVGPGIGGKILSRWVAYHLSQKKPSNERTLAFHTDKLPNGDIVFARGGAKNYIPGKKVLAVEDVMTTGGTAKKLIEATRRIGGIVVGLGVLCIRGKVTLADVSNPPKMFSLIKLAMNSWAREECERIGPCSRGVPINVEVGHGREFLASRHRGERVS